MEIGNLYQLYHNQPMTTMHFRNLNLKNEDYYKLSSGDFSGFNFPLTFIHNSGQKLKNILTPIVGLHFLSDHLINVLKENSISGWKTFPIKLLTQENEEVKGYHGFSITGKSGDIEWEKSPIFEKKYVEHGPLVKFYKEMHPGLADWDGSDIFMPKGSTFFIVTKRVRDLLVANKINNVKFINLTEINIAIYNTVLPDV